MYAVTELQPDLADRLRKALKVAGISVQEMADELGRNRVTVGNYLAGRTTPDKPTLIVWSIRCGVPLDWLIYGIGWSSGIAA